MMVKIIWFTIYKKYKLWRQMLVSTYAIFLEQRNRLLNTQNLNFGACP